MIQQLHTTCTQLKRDEITIPDQWKFEITQPPGKFEKTNISKIIVRNKNIFSTCSLELNFLN